MRIDIDRTSPYAHDDIWRAYKNAVNASYARGDSFEKCIDKVCCNYNFRIVKREFKNGFVTRIILDFEDEKDLVFFKLRWA